MKIVGRYELLDPIGHGGMAVVYLARQIDLDRQVALKELRMFQAPDDPALAERFLREARVAGSMSHPNIVTVHEYFKHEDTPYIAMEYLQRGSLRPWVGRMTVAQIAGVLEGLLAALDHAERYRIVHRDLKPENLLVTDQGQIKVADFGIAKARTMNTNALLTAAGTTVGTPTYMSPEQAMAQELGPYTDLYSVGVMAYELFVGRVPFHDTDTPVAIILRHVNEQIPPAHTVDPAIDRALSNWIDRLLIKDPLQRTQTAEEAWDTLEEVVLRLLGSRWRREARLVTTTEQPAVWPLTPAPFTSTDVDTPVPQPPSDGPLPETPPGEFESFVWGGAAPVAPVDPQVRSAADLDVARPAGPEVGEPETAPEPEPEAAPAPAPEPEPEPEAAPEPEEAEPEPRPVDGEPGFVTFAKGAPASELREPAQEHAQPGAGAEPERAALGAPTGRSGFETLAPHERQPERRDDPAPSADLPAWAMRPAPTPEPAPPSAPASVVGQFDAEARTVMPDAVPERPQTPVRSTPSPQVRRRRRVALLGAGAGVLAIAAVGVVLAGGGGSGGSSDDPPTSAAGTFALTNADLALTVPTSWSERAVPDTLGLRRQEAVAAARGREAYVAAELVSGEAHPTLLPPKLRAALRGRRRDPETIALAGRQAYRYDGLRPRGVRQLLRVYAVLTTDGVATVVCGGSPAAGAAVAGDCDEIASTLKLTSARALPIGPSEDYAAILEKTFATLDARVNEVEIKLAKAPRTVTAQAAVLRQFARAYEDALVSLRGGRAQLNPVDAGLNTRLASVFKTVTSSYGKLERAVQRNDAAARAQAQRALRRVRAMIRTVTAALGSVGYTAAVPSTPATPTIKPPPAPPRQQPNTVPPPVAPGPVAPPPRPSGPPSRPPPPGGSDDG